MAKNNRRDLLDYVMLDDDDIVTIGIQRWHNGKNCNCLQFRLHLNEVFEIRDMVGKQLCQRYESEAKKKEEDE